jgi:DNA-binding LytR/AlgR family response regulator
VYNRKQRQSRTVDGRRRIIAMLCQIGICDDERYQIKVNHLFLNEIAARNGYALEYHGFETGRQLKKYLENRQLDVLFLDIDLGEESGIELASWLSRNYPEVIIIFVTGHREFAEEAFEVDAMGYLVKPYDIKKMENVMKKIMRQFEKHEGKDELFEIVVTYDNRKKKIDCRNILFIERRQAKSVIVTKQGEYQVYETITSLCERIGKAFIRVNQGEVVNESFISEIKGNTVYLKTGKEFTIGRTYRKSVIGRYFGK